VVGLNMDPPEKAIVFSFDAFYSYVPTPCAEVPAALFGLGTGRECNCANSGQWLRRSPDHQAAVPARAAVISGRADGGMGDAGVVSGGSGTRSGATP
jgi:hypothetical protein